MIDAKEELGKGGGDTLRAHLMAGLPLLSGNGCVSDRRWSSSRYVFIAGLKNTILIYQCW